MEKLKKVEAGHYEYKGCTIYRTSNYRDAYNPWKIALTKRTFATLAEAKKYIDEKESNRANQSNGAEAKE
jgi:hypothetical protein